MEEENEFEHFIIIDSKDRNFTAYPSPSEYSILLEFLWHLEKKRVL